MESPQALRKVLSFTLKHCQSRQWLAGAIALTMSLATLAEIMVPTYAGRLIDALAQRPSATPAAADAFAAMAVLGLVIIALRHAATWGTVPLTLSMMSHIAQGAFRRVQRFSTDWHSNSFAGSTVRKITRGNEWAELFEPNAVLTSGAKQRFTGREQLLDVGRRMIAGGFDLATGILSPVVRCRRVLTDISLFAGKPGHATGYAHLTVMSSGVAGPPRWLGSGLWSDELTKCSARGVGAMPAAG